MTGFLTLIESIRERSKRLAEWVIAHTQTDGKVLLVIILLAFFLRAPFLNYPNRTVFDEVIYANFAMHIVNGAPFFDIHPPLARMIFAEIARTVPFRLTELPMETNQAFEDFPYVPLRLFVSFLGVLLVCLVYALGRILGYAPRVAAIPALFVVFDNAFVLYSRVILPDTILLSLGLSGFITAFLATKNVGRKRFWLALVAGLLLGLAASVKWTALGFLGTAFILFFLLRMYWEIILSGVLAVLVYLSVFIAFIFYFPQGGATDPMLYPYNVPAVTQLEFPKDPSVQKPLELMSFLARYHRVMLLADRDPEIAKKTLQSPGPLTWLAAKSSISFWENKEKNKHIILMGNSLLWLFTLFVLIFELTWLMVRFARNRRIPIDRAEIVLLFGYALNYIPFFFIHRPMFLYHYFAALLFLLLLVPRVAPRIVECIARVSNDRLLANTLAVFVVLLIFVNFFFLLPVTYGF